MSNKFVLASAGAGKTTTLISDSLEAVRNNQSVLILTYTQNNQSEIVKKLRETNGCVPEKIKVKGWFSFLLEDLIRPYQRYLFDERISGIVFDQSDPHKRNGRNITGRSERSGDQINSRYYLSKNKAHTTYISKLATSICEAGKSGRGRAATCAPIDRLASIYDLIFIDEVQDLVGWDYSVLKYIIRNQNISLHCVGDFRQTIYQTSYARKNPQTSAQKGQWFEKHKFECSNMNYSWRCVEQICSFADLMHSHQSYERTISKVPESREETDGHVGVYSVTNDNVKAYIERFNPVVLRQNRTVRDGLCRNIVALNYGEAKGSGFDRVLIIPTANYSKFLQGNLRPLMQSKTESALNKLYVAITRAKYSVAFLYDECVVIEGVPVWSP